LVKPGLARAQAEAREVMEQTERGKQRMLEFAKELENMPDDEPCFSEEDRAGWRHFKNKFPGYIRWIADGNVTFRPTPPPSDMHEEDLTAEQMEECLTGHEICPQARHFATLALKHYNSKRVHKFEMATVLLSKCFTEHDGVTYGHVNFTAAPQGQVTSLATKRLFFAELMLVPELQMDETAEPMRVVHVCTIDGSCYGGCHLIRRDIKKSIRNKMDYDRCHACSDRIKHPTGDQFIGGHNSTRTPYYSTF